MGFLSSVSSAVSSAVSDAYSGVRENITAKNLAYASPANALLSAAGRENLASIYQPAMGVIGSFTGGAGGSGGLASIAGNVLGNNPDTPAWLASILGGQSQKKETEAAGGGVQPIFIGGAAQSNLPAWLIPAGIAAAAVVLILVLKK